MDGEFGGAVDSCESRNGGWPRRDPPLILSMSTYYLLEHDFCRPVVRQAHSERSAYKPAFIG